MRYLLLLCLPLVAQVQTPLTVYQSSGTATGEIRLQERRTNGSNHVGLAAPQSVAADLVWTLPATDGTNGQSLVTNGSGVLSWGPGASQWTTSGTSIYYNGGPVGIGENTPAKGLLSVFGSNGFAYTPFNQVAAARFRTGSNSAILLGTTIANTSGWTRGMYWSYQLEDFALTRFKDDETATPINDFYVAANGRVGIGTVSPTEPLTVNGNLDIIGSGALEIGGTTVINSSRAANFTGLTIATGAVNGYVLQTNASGVASWAAVPSCANCVVNGGNTLGGLTIGTNDSQPLSLETDNTARWRVTAAGMVQPLIADTYDIGELTNNRVRGVYAQIVDTAKSGGTNDYIQTRKLQFADSGGTLGFWSVAASATTGTAAISFQDNSGSRWLVGRRAVSGSAANETFVYSDWVPNARSTSGGDAVNDTVRPSLGSLNDRWTYVFGNNVDTNTITVRIGAASGYVLTSDAFGNASWAVAPGSLPAADTTSIVKGSVDATKLLRFEVDGFTSATTRVLTPQNASYTLAGTDLSQTFSGTQTFSGLFKVSGNIASDLVPDFDGSYLNGTSSKKWGIIWTYNASIDGTLYLEPGTVFEGSIVPSQTNLYAIGTTSARLSTVVTTNANISGTITAPNGNTGWSGTRTIRDSAGTGTCTLIFSAGILTGGTC